MSIERTHIDYLADILDAIEKVSGFIEGMTFEGFTQDDKTIFAVVRGLEIVGASTKNSTGLTGFFRINRIAYFCS